MVSYLNWGGKSALMFCLSVTYEKGGGEEMELFDRKAFQVELHLQKSWQFAELHSLG